MTSLSEKIKETAAFLKEKGLEFNYYSDKEKSFQKALEIHSIPTMIFVDQEGKIKNVGFVLNDVEKSNFGYRNKYGYGYYAEGKTWFDRLKNKIKHIISRSRRW